MSLSRHLVIGGLGGLVLLSACGSDGAEALVAEVREATAQYATIEAAEAAGYSAAGEPCASGPDGTMGFHALHEGLMGDPALDPLQPEILVYIPEEDGTLRLAAVEYFLADADGDLETDDDRPSLFGTPFDGPMVGHGPTMPVHYDLHVWLHEENPDGLFAMWNPAISC